ncbi:MAG TPA: DNA ligase D, partial [Chitinophagaceae bacterium]
MITTSKKKAAIKTGRSNKRKPAGKAPFPKDIQPMLATLVDQPVDEPGWLYELKWDGYRALSYVNNGKIDIRSRNNKSFNKTYYPIYQALQQWDVRAVVDGEIVVVDENGFSDFADLQNWRSEADGQLIYYVFDLLWLNGVDLMQTPLKERRELLRSVIPGDDSIIRMSQDFEASGKELFDVTHKMGLEGIIAKKASSIYVPGIRSKEWLKIKTELRQEAIIGGYTINEGTNKLFSALLLGLYENGEFRFIGPVGTGFNKKTQEEIVRKLKPLVIKKCPFSEEPDYNKPSRFRPNPPRAEVIWVSPKVVVEISYRELTKDGSIRHPSFKGLREDKNAKEVRRELPERVPALVEREKTLLKKNAPAPRKERKTLLNPADETQVRSVGGHELKFTNLSKVYWPRLQRSGMKEVTKRDMINYYYQVAPFILPYIKDRPQTLNRFPHGINGESFYQKDVKGKVPDWMTTFPYHSETDGRDKEFLVATDEASLLYIASLGCIEINPWNSRIQSPDNPDWCIIDLDP